MWFLNKEVRKELKNYSKKIKEERREKARLLSKDMDYNFLQKIVDNVSRKNVEIEITLTDGTKLKVEPKKEKTKQSSYYDGNE